MTRAEGGPYVLYVDDEPANLTVFTAVLGNRLPVLTASSAAEGLALLEQREVAVLLSDQRMPGQSGVTLLASARTASPHTVRMLVTAYSDLQAAIDAINDGCVRRYIRKPWTGAELVTTVRDAYSVYQTEASLRALERRLVQTERFYALGVVAAGISHELRNPATWLRNSAELCGQQLGELRELLVGSTPSLDEQLRSLARLGELITYSSDAAERILDIVGSVDVATRSPRPQLERVDLRSLVDATLRLVETQFGRSVRIERETDEWPIISGSRTALGQVIANVVVNAAQAVEKRDDARVVLRSRIEDTQLLIEVDDNGVGIPADDLPRIFDPFFSLKEGGTGLGLAISRRIAREHGGELSAENLGSGGARFRLSLPLEISRATG